jgi:hypothetical protein
MFTSIIFGDEKKDKPGDTIIIEFTDRHYHFFYISRKDEITEKYNVYNFENFYRFGIPFTIINDKIKIKEPKNKNVPDENKTIKISFNCDKCVIDDELNKYILNQLSKNTFNDYQLLYDGRNHSVCPDTMIKSGTKLIIRKDENNYNIYLLRYTMCRDLSLVIDEIRQLNSENGKEYINKYNEDFKVEMKQRFKSFFRLGGKPHKKTKNKKHRKNKKRKTKKHKPKK